MYYDHSGVASRALFCKAMDLNKDGYLDIKGSGPINGEYGTIKLLGGVDSCKKGSYSFDSGLSKYGKVIIKLFDGFKIKFMDGDQIIEEGEARKGKTYPKLKAPEKEGYEFKGWKVTESDAPDYKDGDQFDFAKAVNGNLTLTAVWEKKEAKDPGKEPGKEDGKGDQKPVGEAKGTKLTEGKNKPVYTVLSQGDAENPPTVSYTAAKSQQGKAKTVKVPDTVTFNGVTYKVVSVTNGSLANEKKAKTIEIGENVESLPNSAFKACKKMKVLKIKNKNKVIKLSKKTFKGIKGKITLKVPAAFVADYKKQIKKLKLTKKVSVKKL